MKKIAKGIHRLSQRAAEIRQVVETMPAKAASIREAVAATTGHMQQLRADLASGLPPLLPSSETDTLARLREIDDAADVLVEAGYLLSWVDLDLGAPRRLRVRLERAEAIEVSQLRALLATHAHRPMLKALLSGIVQATELAEKVELTQLDFSEVVVEVGAGQAVRIGWRAEPAPASIATKPVVATEARPPTFSQSSFFARPVPAPAAPLAGADAPDVLGAANVLAKPPASPALAANWRSSALDRFKKMPDLSKRTSQ